MKRPTIRQDDAARGRRFAMRTRGYNDGLAGRPAAFLDVEYQNSYRHGWRERQRILGPFKR